MYRLISIVSCVSCSIVVTFRGRELVAGLQARTDALGHLSSTRPTRKALWSVAPSEWAASLGTACRQPNCSNADIRWPPGTLLAFGGFQAVWWRLRPSRTSPYKKTIPYARTAIKLCITQGLSVVKKGVVQGFSELGPMPSFGRLDTGVYAAASERCTATS